MAPCRRTTGRVEGRGLLCEGGRAAGSPTEPDALGATVMPPSPVSRDGGSTVRLGRSVWGVQEALRRLPLRAKLRRAPLRLAALLFQAGLVLYLVTVIVLGGTHSSLWEAPFSGLGFLLCPVASWVPSWPACRHFCGPPSVQTCRVPGFPRREQSGTSAVRWRRGPGGHPGDVLDSSRAVIFRCT